MSLLEIDCLNQGIEINRQTQTPLTSTGDAKILSHFFKIETCLQITDDDTNYRYLLVVEPVDPNEGWVTL